MNLPALALSVVLLALNGFFVAAEFALVAARRSRMEQLAAAGDGRARAAVAGMRELSLMLAGSQLGITAASLALGRVTEPAVAAGLESLLHRTPLPADALHPVAFTLALSIVVFLHMVVGEMAPKSWVITHPEDSALLIARPFRVFATVSGPVIRFLNWLANGVVRLLGVEPVDETSSVHAPADLLMLLRESADEGQLAVEHQEMLSRAIDLSRLDAQAAMVPRSDVVALPAAATVDEAEHVARRSGRSRLPVYDEDLDAIRGILHVKALLRLDGRARSTATAGELAIPALVTPETRPLEALMVDMRQQRQHLAVVVDEHGTVTGLVALEDVLEELIGEFDDESDRRGRAPRRRGDGALVFTGALRPDELEDHSGVALPEGDWETVAGYVIAQLGRLPTVGDVVERDGNRFEVTRMDGHRVVELALVTDPPPPPVD
ncbi:MAG: hemolysin family protein [Actinomycetota bacterium]|nr:hemolysin family protein [Actinomycetota bacterium]